MEITKFILLNIVCFFWIYLNAAFDDLKIRENKSIDNALESFFRVFFMEVLAIIISNGVLNKLFFASTIYFLSLFWLLFDYTLNNMRGLNWDYVSPEVINKFSVVDKFFNLNISFKDVPKAILIIKLSLYLITLLIEILILR